MLWDTIVGSLVGKVAPEVAAYYREKQKLENELQLEQLRGRLALEAAKTQAASEAEARDHEWELESIKNSGWKDEWVLILLSVPLVLTFFGTAGAQVVTDGFAALEATPDWYRWLIVTIFAAVYGLRVWRRKP